ncbi:MAG: bacillithiol system redox-active protein YtxJ [Lentisphaerae bacterium]|nr:MAG: bacillithiol system redox-active protein YtxJ [Lentisphaerota bacterium]
MIPIESVETIEQLDEILQTSVPVFLFKHSTACPISHYALAEFKKFAGNVEHPSLKLYLIDLLKYREISNAVQQRTGVRHQSPQAILLHNGSVVWHASHSAIMADKLEQAMRDLCS